MITRFDVDYTIPNGLNNAGAFVAQDNREGPLRVLTRQRVCIYEEVSSWIGLVRSSRHLPVWHTPVW
jgi:hypothetical protein